VVKGEKTELESSRDGGNRKTQIFDHSAEMPTLARLPNLVNSDLSRCFSIFPARLPVGRGYKLKTLGTLAHF